MNYFYNKNKQTEKLSLMIENKADEFISAFSGDENFKKYIKSFGIVGPAAREEGFYINNDIRSDVDFYLMTNFISLSNAKKIQKLFRNFFSKDLDVSLLIFSPNSYKKPDLMMFELTNSGKLLYGDRLEKTSIDKISRFEGVRNLVYRGFFFLDLFIEKNNKLILKENVSDNKFLYAFSKVIFALGEVVLLLDKSYTASNIERNITIKNNKLALSVDGFIDLHQIMHEFRYENKIPDNFNIDVYTNLGFKLILEGYKLIFKELFLCNNLECNNFLKVRSKGITFFANRILYFVYSFLNFKKIKLFIFKEPFIYFVDNYIKFLNKVLEGKKINQDELDLLVEDWKTAPWFYHKI